MRRLRPTPHVAKFSDISRVCAAGYSAVRRAEKTAVQMITELKPELQTLLRGQVLSASTTAWPVSPAAQRPAHRSAYTDAENIGGAPMRAIASATAEHSADAAGAATHPVPGQRLRPIRAAWLIDGTGAPAIRGALVLCDTAGTIVYAGRAREGQRGGPRPPVRGSRSLTRPRAPSCRA